VSVLTFNLEIDAEFLQSFCAELSTVMDKRRVLVCCLATSILLPVCSLEFSGMFHRA
jgi:hypothetical protein